MGLSSGATHAGADLYCLQEILFGSNAYGFALIGVESQIFISGDRKASAEKSNSFLESVLMKTG
jgi:hypothetical protein